MHRSLLVAFFKIARSTSNHRGVSHRNVPKQRNSEGMSPPQNRKSKKRTFSVRIPREDPDAAYAADENGKVEMSMEDVVKLGKQMGIDYPTVESEEGVQSIRQDGPTASTKDAMRDSREYHRTLETDEPKQNLSSDGDEATSYESIAAKLLRDGLVSNAKHFSDTLSKSGTIFIAVSPNYPVFVQSTIAAQLVKVSGKLLRFTANLAYVVAIDPSSSSYSSDSFVKWVQRNVALGTVFITDMFSLVAWRAIDVCFGRLGNDRENQCNLIDASFSAIDPLQIATDTDDQSEQSLLRKCEKMLRKTSTLALDCSLFGWSTILPVRRQEHDSQCSQALVRAFHRLFTQSASAAFALAESTANELYPKSLQNISTHVVLCAPRTSNSGVRARYFMEEIIEQPDPKKEFTFESTSSDGTTTRALVASTEVLKTLTADADAAYDGSIDLRSAHLRFLRESLENAVKIAWQNAMRQPKASAGCYVVYITASVFFEENERVVKSLFRDEIDGYVNWNGINICRIDVRQDLPEFLRESASLKHTYCAFPEETSSDGVYVAILHVRAQGSETGSKIGQQPISTNTPTLQRFFGFPQNKLEFLACGTFAPTYFTETSRWLIAQPTSFQPSQQQISEDLNNTFGLRVLEKLDFKYEIVRQRLEGMDSSETKIGLQYAVPVALHSAACHRYMLPLWRQPNKTSTVALPKRHIHFYDVSDLLLLLYLGRLPTEIITVLGDRLSGWESCLYDTSSIKEDIRANAEQQNTAQDCSEVGEIEAAHVVPGAVLLTATIHINAHSLSENLFDALESFLCIDTSTGQGTLSLMANIHYSAATVDPTFPRKSMSVTTNRCFELILPETLRKALFKKKPTTESVPKTEDAVHFDLSTKYLVTEPFLVAVRDALSYLRSKQGLPYTYTELLSSYDTEAQKIFDAVVRESAMQNRVEVLEDLSSKASTARRENEQREFREEFDSGADTLRMFSQEGIELVEEVAVQPDFD